MLWEEKIKKLIPLSLSLTLLILFNGCSSSENNPKQTIKNQIQSEDIYVLSGKVQADNSANLSSQVNAKVSQVKVDVGAKVNAGDPIVYLDTQDIQSQLNQAEAAVTTNQANLDKIKAGTRPESIAAQNALIGGDKTAYDIAQKNYEREEQLLQSGNAAEVNLEQAKQVLSSAKSKYDVDVQNLTAMQNGPTESDINASEALVKQSQAAAEIQKASLSHTVITAPISGTVTAKNINVGEMSGVSQQLITIVNSNELHIDSYAPEELLPKLKVGLQVNVKISEFPSKIFQGEISTINEQIDPRNKNALVKITLKDGNDNLKPGMFAEIGLKNKVGE
jgi:multidrug efflux pump subunit AcrA (membrane-fusion protein)